MPRRMTLLEIVSILETFDRELLIYALEPWTKESPAIVAVEPEDDSGLPPEAARLGLTYFHQVDAAVQFLDGFHQNSNPRPSVTQACERLILYAINDA